MVMLYVTCSVLFIFVLKPYFKNDSLSVSKLGMHSVFKESFTEAAYQLFEAVWRI